MKETTKMERREVFEYVKEQYGTEPDYPWRDWNAVLRHKENKKWYGLVMEVEQNKLGLDGVTLVDVLNVKCDPVLIGSLRMQSGFHPNLAPLFNFPILTERMP